jgi:hypothetical protein
MKPLPRLVPITGKAALAFIHDVHRHLPRLQGALWAVSVEDMGQIVGVATAGNPARVWQGTGRFVISRVAVRHGEAWDEAWGASEHGAPYCSMLYASLCRAGKALGYQEAWTYTLPHERGVSLVASGFWNMGLTRDEGEWGRPSRPRLAAVCPDRKKRWVRPLTREATIRIATPVMEAIATFARRFASEKCTQNWDRRAA